jgi:hypothetical protein
MKAQILCSLTTISLLHGLSAWGKNKVTTPEDYGQPGSRKCTKWKYTRSSGWLHKQQYLSGIAGGHSGSSGAEHGSE